MLDFEKEVRIRRENNLYLLKQSLNSLDSNSDLLQKIKSYADRYGLVEQYVYDKLLLWDEDMFFNGFEKDPWRQNIYEILQLEFMKKIELETSLISWVKKLSSSGKEAKYLKKWEIVNLKKVDRWDLKSLDFYWYYEFWNRRLEFYTTCKYTQDEWWAQDNQANDVYTTYKEARNLEDINLFFIALVDGEYYYRQKWWGKNFFDYLNGQSNGNRCICVDSRGIFGIIKKEILNRLCSQPFNKDIETEKERISQISWKYFATI